MGVGFNTDAPRGVRPESNQFSSVSEGALAYVIFVHTQLALGRSLSGHTPRLLCWPAAWLTQQRGACIYFCEAQSILTLSKRGLPHLVPFRTPMKLKVKQKNDEPDRPVELIELNELSFDLQNPRYGAGAKNINTEQEALDHIVRMFGVNDVLSSLSVNGFFDSEPLVGIRMPKDAVTKIIEGNRRLAACLILAGDKRAENQAKLREKYAALHNKNGKPRISPIPVIVYEGKDALRQVLPFIGVRHIKGFLEWDSYAKAAWVDQILKDHDLTLDQIMDMLGDTNGTIPRMLSGYRFVNQLISEGEFKPAQSQRKGRGSNPDYPFSWVYTALDNPPIKEFVGLKERHGVATEKPVPEEKLSDAGLVLTFMFGDKTKGIAAVVEDSREIGDLAKAIRDPATRAKLKEGKKLSIVMEESRPSLDRLQEGFQKVADQLKDLSGLIVPGNLKKESAVTLVDSAKSVVNLSRKAYADLTMIAAGDIDKED